jgi:hypothetical protein
MSAVRSRSVVLVHGAGMSAAADVVVFSHRRSLSSSHRIGGVRCPPSTLPTDTGPTLAAPGGSAVNAAAWAAPRSGRRRRSPRGASPA